MKLIVFALATAALVSTPAFASKELAQKSACMGCHAPDRKLVGPAFQEVARKYHGQKDAEANLAASIKRGGSGKWGPIPMPAQAALSDTDAQKLASWVMSGAR